MKNNSYSGIFILCLLIFASVKANGQITITKSSVPSSAGNIIYTTSNDSIDVSVTGGNQTWDYSKIIPASQDTYKYAKPAGLYALSFFGDIALDLKLGNISGAYSFFKLGTGGSDYRQVGTGITIPTVGLPTALPSQLPDIIYRFPIKYGNVDSCVFLDTATILGSFKIKLAGKRVNTVDGWGQVTTPYKTYDCIRIKSEVTEIDTFIIIPINRSRIEYKWLATTEQIPVMEAVITPNAPMVLHYRDSYKVIVNPNGPVVDFDVPDTNVFINTDTVAFNNKTTKALTYNWNITPAGFTFVGGTTATSKNPKVIFNTAGLYTVALTATGIGGNNILTKKNYINATHNTGIIPVTKNYGIDIYPNPAHSGVFLHFNESMINGKADITVSNIFGQTLLQKTAMLTGQDYYINLEGFSYGLYFVKYQDGKKTYIQKLELK